MNPEGFDSCRPKLQPAPMRWSYEFKQVLHLFMKRAVSEFGRRASWDVGNGHRGSESVDSASRSRVKGAECLHIHEFATLLHEAEGVAAGGQAGEGD